MHYVSTRNASLNYSAAHAIEQGLSREGGLFLPNELPVLPDGCNPESPPDFESYVRTRTHFDTEASPDPAAASPGIV